MQPSFDKQFVRNWLTGPESGWDRGGDRPPPPLPPDIVDATRDALHRSLRTHFGPAVRRLDRLGRMTDARAPPSAEAGRPPPRAPRRRLHRPVRVAARQVRSRGDRLPRGRERLHRADRPTHLAPLRQKIFDEIKARTKETDLSVPTRRGDWWYYGRSFEGKQYGVHCRCPVADPDDWTPPTFDEHTEIPGEQVLLDENVEAEGTTSSRSAPPGSASTATRLAYSVDVVGDERYTLRFKDLRTGELYDDEIVGIGCRRDLGRRQPHRLLRHGRRRVAAGHRVAAPAGRRPARREGVSRTRRAVLARGGAHPQRQVRAHRGGQRRSPRRSATPTPPIPRPSSPRCCHAAKASSTRSSTRSSAARTAS